MWIVYIQSENSFTYIDRSDEVDTHRRICKFDKQIKTIYLCVAINSWSTIAIKTYF